MKSWRNFSKKLKKCDKILGKIEEIFEKSKFDKIWENFWWTTTKITRTAEKIYGKFLKIFNKFQKICGVYLLVFKVNFNEMLNKISRKFWKVFRNLQEITKFYKEVYETLKTILRKFQLPVRMLNQSRKNI